MKKKRVPRNLLQLASTLIEAALAIPVFLVFLLFIIDLARYFFISVVLNWAAHDAVDFASKSEVETNTNATTCDLSGCQEPDSGNCSRYRTICDAIEQRALNTALRVVTASNDPSAAQLTAWTHYTAADYNNNICDPVKQQYGNGLLTRTSDIIFLRPGERVRSAQDPNVVIEHPTRACHPDSGKTCGFDLDTGYPKAAENWSGVLGTNPLIVQMMVQFSPVTPFLPTIPIRIVQAGYRTTRKFGFGAAGPPPPTATPTKTATPTPTPPACEAYTMPRCNEGDLTRCVNCIYSYHCGPCILGCIDVCQGFINTYCDGNHSQNECESWKSFCGILGCPYVVPTPAATYTPTGTPTETSTRTVTPTRTSTRTPTETGTPGPTPTVTETPTITATPTLPMRPTITPSPTATPTATSTDEPTITPTPVAFCTADGLCGSTGCSANTCYGDQGGTIGCCACCIGQGACAGCLSSF